MKDLKDLIIVKGDSTDWYFAFLQEDQDHSDVKKATIRQVPMEFEDVRIFYHNLLPVHDRSGNFIGFQEQSGLRCLPLYDGPAKITLIPTVWYPVQGKTAKEKATKLLEVAEKNEVANRSGLALPRS